MKSCPNCAQEIPENAPVCRHCGHRFDEQAPEKPAAGQSLPPPPPPYNPAPLPPPPPPPAATAAAPTPPTSAATAAAPRASEQAPTATVLSAPPKRWRCTVCGWVFERASKATRHVETHHRDRLDPRTAVQPEV